MTWQDEMFVERLVRLDQNHSRRSKLMHNRSVIPRWTVDLGRVATIFGAGLIGVLSVPLSRYAMFHSQGLGNSSANPELVMAIDGVFAFCIAFFLVRMVLSVSCISHMIAQVTGIWIALTSMHNLVHSHPEFWAQAFSAEWVERMIRTTEPGTLYLLGTGFP